MPGRLVDGVTAIRAAQGIGHGRIIARSPIDGTRQMTTRIAIEPSSHPVEVATIMADGRVVASRTIQPGDGPQDFFIHGPLAIVVREHQPEDAT